MPDIVVAGSAGLTITYIVYEEDGDTALDITGGTSPKILYTNVETQVNKEVSGSLGTAASGEIEYTQVSTDFARNDVGKWRATPKVTLSGAEYFGPWADFWVKHPMEPDPDT